MNDITKTTWFKSPLASFLNIYGCRWPSALHRPYEDIINNFVDLIGEWEDFYVVELNDCEKKMAAKLAKCISMDELTLFTSITRQLLFFVEYLRGSSTLRKLEMILYDEDFPHSVDIKALARALHSNGVPLTHLDLGFFFHGDEIAVALSEVLESNTTLTHLRLSFDDEPTDPIGPSGASALARALSKNSTLKCLLLGQNSIEDEGAKRFADALQTNSTLTQLDIRENSIGASGTKAICKALQSNHVMTLLILAGNTIGDSGADALAGALQSPATQLSHLDLAHCKITSAGVESLAGALQTNRSLTYLGLKASNISFSATALAEALRLNRTLTHLDLSASNIGASGTEVICMALQSNHVMTYL